MIPDNMDAYEVIWVSGAVSENTMKRYHRRKLIPGKLYWTEVKLVKITFMRAIAIPQCTPFLFLKDLDGVLHFLQGDTRIYISTNPNKKRIVPFELFYA